MLDLWSFLALIKPYLYIWCLLVSAYLLDFRTVIAACKYLQSLISQGQVLLGAQSSSNSQACGSLFTASIYDISRILGCYRDVVRHDYLMSIYRSGQDFHKVLASDIQEFLLINQSLLSIYEFLFGALKTSAMIVTMLCILWFSFGVDTYDFTSMIMCFFVLHIVYVIFFKVRILALLKAQLLDRGDLDFPKHSPLEAFLHHRRCVQQWLRYYWYRRSQSLSACGIEEDRASDQRMFAHTSRQFTRESRLRQDFALFQIFGGVSCLIFFLMDNFQRFI